MPLSPESLAAIDRDAVLSAISKYKELGQRAFLRTYGYTRARTYVLVYEGRSYDAKAIMGVAYGIANPELGPLSGKDFHSGAATVQRPLERLGFQVNTDRKGRARPATGSVETVDTPEGNVPLDDEAYPIERVVTDGCFVPLDEVRRMLAALREKKNLVLQGPPGTGKTWLAKRLGFALRNTARLDESLRIVQFHPTLSYEDFVRGYRPGAKATLEMTDGVMMEMVTAARANPGEDFVLVIEEINRGNPAQIFGEMLTLLEGTKRNEAESLDLAYKKTPVERVFIPPNLYVIGTMNIADRSLALVDLALRRRFAFFTLAPQLNDLWFAWCRDHLGLEEAELRKIQARVDEINDQISEDRALGAQFKLGHSFFTPAKPLQAGRGWQWFQQVVETEIHPLLNEYWFDQPSKADEARRRLAAPL